MTQHPKYLPITTAQIRRFFKKSRKTHIHTKNIRQNPPTVFLKIKYLGNKCETQSKQKILELDM